MNLGRLSKSERTLWHAFPRGELVNLSGARDRTRTIRAEVIAALLLGATPAEPGRTPALRLDGARVTGPLDLGHGQIAGPVRLCHCEFDSAIQLAGAHIRDFDLEGSRFPGLDASLAEIDGNLGLDGCESSRHVVLTGAHIAGALRMEDADLRHPGDVALLANRLVVDGDLFALRAVVVGEMRLSTAQVGGIVLLDKAVIRAAGARNAFNGRNMTVDQHLLARNGFVAEGQVALTGLDVRASVDFGGATLTNPSGVAIAANGVKVGGYLSLDGHCSVQGMVVLSHTQVTGGIYLSNVSFSNPENDAIRCRYVEAGTLVLGPGIEADGTVDFRHSRFSVIRDDPSCWPQQLRLSGVTYDRLEPPLPAAERVRWLSRDVGGLLPENYETLAGMYRRHGDDAAARTVLLARERARRKLLPWYGQAWSLLQEITVGYGYRPLRAAAWLVAFLAVGNVVFSLHHPSPLAGAPHPDFNPFIYTLDLLVPLVNFGLRDAYASRGPEQWLAYLLIAVGWIFATTIAAGIARVLQRK